MHRHGYQGRKLQRDTGPRRALVRGLATSLVLHEAVTTTEAKAKEVAPYFERLVTYAKKGTLAGRRALGEELLTENAVQKLIQELLPAFADRNGGYTSIIHMPNRRGDNAPMARLSLVLNEQARAQAVKKSAKKPAAAVAAKTEEPVAEAKPEGESK
jgi:large subunit ribosomal protein L17